jgi:Ca2+-binding RTX toxin-like protein
MAIIETVAQYNTGTGAYDPNETVIIRDTGANISSISINGFLQLSLNNVDTLDATDDVLVLNTKQYNNLFTVGLSPEDFVILSDTGFRLDGGTLEEISSLAVKGVDIVDSIDDTINFAIWQYRALGPVALTPGDNFTLVDSGIAFSGLTVAEVAGLGAKGVDAIDALDGEVILSSDQYAALGSLPLAAGDDLKINGASRSETIVARSSDDTVKGFQGNDKLNGAAGDDWLYGGLGKDTLTGNIGRDAFIFDTKPNKKTNLDKIADYNVKDDSVFFDNAIFKKLGSKGTEFVPAKLNKAFFKVGDSAKDRNDYVVYDKQKGILYYDADGSGGGKAVEIATLKKNLKMTAADFFVI